MFFARVARGLPRSGTNGPPTHTQSKHALQLEAGAIPPLSTDKELKSRKWKELVRGRRGTRGPDLRLR